MFFLREKLVFRQLQNTTKVLTRLKARMTSPIEPPSDVRGMTEWKKERFKTKSTLPCLRIKADRLNGLKKSLEKYTVRIPSFRSVQEFADSVDTKIIVLNPP